MNKKRMMNRGKKFVAVALAFAMMVPVVFGQTVLTKADETETVPAQSQLLELKTSAPSVSMERGDVFTLSLMPKKAFTVPDGVGLTGKLNFQSHEKDPDTGKPIEDLNANFRIVKVSAPEGWATGYRGDEGVIAISNSGAQDVATSKAIADIQVEVLKTTNDVDVTLESIALGAQVTTGSGTSDASEKNSYITATVTNTNRGKHEVQLSVPETVKVNVSSQYDSDNVYIPVTIEKNTGFNAIAVTFTYESQKLNYVGYKLSPRALTYLNYKTEDNSKAGLVSICFVGNDDTKFTGDFLTLEFQPRTTSVGKTQITPAIKELRDVSGVADLKSSLAKDKISVDFVEGKKLGDVNQDGSINLLDATYVLQAYNGVRKLTETQEKLADVNGDKKVNLVDVLKIMKYCNGEIKNFN